MANLLIHEQSPYLLQHAHNPVNWRAWNEETFHLAKAQHKMMLISIGYSACHWCHVMEKECFENEAAARVMNKYFVCVKVDREERPDIDAVYMQAIQLMTSRGGWPLNCFTLPDGRPVYGGTYFPLQHWLQVLEQLHTLFIEDEGQMIHYATQLTAGIAQGQQFVSLSNFGEITLPNIKVAVEKWKPYFDNEYGGAQHVPKFPMPCNYSFLLHYSRIYQDKEIAQHVLLTLQKMASGGIYDQLAGGFARYSTDEYWKVPHFEKMLYDNAQLVSLYANYCLMTPNPRFLHVIRETINFIEITFIESSDEGFYSAMDADSEGEEGLFYTWKKAALQKILGDDFEAFAAIFGINQHGYWEDGKYILLHLISADEFELHFEKIARWKSLLLKHRNERTHPLIDNKCVTSWNAMMIGAMADAACALQETLHIAKAKNYAQGIIDRVTGSNYKLFHVSKNNVAYIGGFLEDYAHWAQALIKLYRVTGEEFYLIHALHTVEYTIAHFWDHHDGLFFLTDSSEEICIVRQKEVQDNVIPSSNSTMGHVLFELYVYFDKESYILMVKNMCKHMVKEVEQHCESYSAWALLMLRLDIPVKQLAIPKENYTNDLLLLSQRMQINHFPYCINHDSQLPFIKDKNQNPRYHYCVDRVCGLPLSTIDNLMDSLQQREKND